MIYTVRAGDSPARIAQAMTGRGERMAQLVAANRHKRIVSVGGRATFASLGLGEKLNVPGAWAPFTRGRWGLGDEGSIQTELAALQAASSVQPVADGDGSYMTYIQGAQAAGTSAVTVLGPDIDNTYGINLTGPQTQAAFLLNNQLAYVNSSSTSTLSDATAAQDLLGLMVVDYTAAIAAGKAGGGGGGGGGGGNVQAAAAAALAALNADPNYCVDVGQNGSPVNVAVHAFKAAWNAANPNNPVPIGTGKYEQSVADAIGVTLNTTAPAGCTGGGGGGGGGGGNVGPPTDQSCPANQIVDASTWQCAPICPDDSRPCGGQCIGYSGPPLATQGAACPGGVSPPSGGSKAGVVAAVLLVVVGGGAAYAYSRRKRHAA